MYSISPKLLLGSEMAALMGEMSQIRQPVATPLTGREANAKNVLFQSLACGKLKIQTRLSYLVLLFSINRETVLLEERNFTTRTYPKYIGTSQTRRWLIERLKTQRSGRYHEGRIAYLYPTANNADTGCQKGQQSAAMLRSGLDAASPGADSSLHPPGSSP